MLRTVFPLVRSNSLTPVVNMIRPVLYLRIRTLNRYIHHKSHPLSNTTPRIVIMGAGITGLSTAHYLLTKTTQWNEKPIITIIDKYDSVAQGTSRKNGQLLCPSLSHPWTSTPVLFGTKAVLPNLLLTKMNPRKSSSVSPISLDWRAGFDRRLWKFGLHWAGTKFALSKQQHTRIENLMKYSMKCMNDVNDDLIHLDYGRVAIGTKTHDGEFSDIDSSGDIGRFCNELAKTMMEKYVGRIEFEFEKRVCGFETDGDVINGVNLLDSEGRDETLTANSFVVALGIDSTPICETINVECPIYPVKGYLITFTSNISIPYNWELSNKAFVSPLGNNTYRLSGFADFIPLSRIEEGKKCVVDSSRSDALIKVARDHFPDLKVVDVDCGFRPVTPDDTPVIGPTSKLKNLYLCTGHGSKGWTMGAGSGKLLADLMLGLPTEIDPVPYAPSRFDIKFPMFIKAWKGE